MASINLIPTIELLYMANQGFRKQIEAIRKEYQIEVGENVSFLKMIEFDGKLWDDEKFSDKYQEQVKFISEQYDGLDNLIDLEVFIETGVVPIQSDPTNAKKFLKRYGAITKPKILNYRPLIRRDNCFLGISVLFTIREDIKLCHLDDWFNLHKHSIIKSCSEHFSTYSHSVEVVENGDRLIDILRLKNETNLTYREVADKISEKYPDDEDVINGRINEQSVKKRYLRYIKHEE